VYSTKAYDIFAVMMRGQTYLHVSISYAQVICTQQRGDIMRAKCSFPAFG